ncbi:Dimethylaniline monooxygenase [N-oxide-forming] 5 [Sciurus carolinensis]|uniref:Flavin-containing monooxygenase n=1 Tax=Sciurus carolinensis TaxID=30640 RepID=A0AA41MUR8_SCICA|nr:Dimethylaniline monooxygenase [N-oxide-forming] 5 [Sciurus carolinensis]
MVCTGHHTNAHLSLESFPGIEKFKGQYFHSQDYKNPEELAEKRVFIIFGNSGGDLAVEISYSAKQSYQEGRPNRVWMAAHCPSVPVANMGLGFIASIGIMIDANGGA